MGTNNGTVVGLTKVHDAGTPTQKLNIVVVSEGYQSSQLTAFAGHVDDLLGHMLAEPPFDEEENGCAFNLYRLEVISDDSGADDPDCGGTGTGTTADTYFDASFCWDGVIRRLLYCDDTQVIDTVDDYLPEWHAIIVLVNSTTRGGGGGSVAVLSVGSGDWKDVALHEMGHSLYGLADEYDYWSGCGVDTDRDNYTGGEPAEPNVTTNTNAATLKWAAQLSTGVALPTMANPDCSNCNNDASPVAEGTVGLFEGARYFHCGVYRPEYECMMRSTVDGFCAVCRTEIRDVLQPFAQSANITLRTPSISFLDVPEGTTTIRAARWEVQSCLDKTFTVVAGPTDSAFALFDGPSALSDAADGSPRDVMLWFVHTAQASGSTHNGTVTVRCDETGDEWVIPISANSVTRPTVAIQLVLDQSGSMLDTTPDGRSKEQLLKDSAGVAIDMLYGDSGIGINSYDHDPHPGMDVEVAGAPAIGLGRLHARATLAGYAANPYGWTAIGDGVEFGHAKLQAASGYTKTAMVVLTDGIETDHKYLYEVAPGILDTTVFAIGLGTADQIQPATLNTLTNNTGGYLLMTGTLSSDDIFLLAKYYQQILAGISNNDIVLDPEGAVVPEVEVRIPFDLADTDIECTVAVLADMPGVMSVVIETPTGRYVTPATGAGDLTVEHFTSSQGSYYRFSLPHLPPTGPACREGRWHAHLRVDSKRLLNYLREIRRDVSWDEVLSTLVKYSVSVQTWSNLRMRGQLLQPHHGPAAPMTLRATLTEYGASLRGTAAVRAELTRPDGSMVHVVLHEVDAGVFEADVTPNSPGVFRARILAVGETWRGHVFTREHLATGATWIGGDQPTQYPKEPDDGLTRVLECICRGKVIRPELRKRLIAAGFDIDALLRCVCDDRKEEPRRTAVELDRAVLTELTDTLNKLVEPR